MDNLRTQLSEAKKALRAAREEARNERVESAKLRQQIALLKIELNSTKEHYKTDSMLIKSSSSSLSLLQVSAFCKYL